MASVEWGEYKLGDLFKIKIAKSIDRNKILLEKNGLYEFVGRTSANNGVQGKVNNLGYAPNPPKTLSISQVGESICLYRPYEWYASQNIFVLYPKYEYSIEIFNFFVATINKSLYKYKEAYIYPTIKKLESLTIKLPLKRNNIDFDFMEKFMVALEVTSIEDLKSYLSTPELQNYNLTEEEKHVVDNYDSITYKEFNIVDIFNVKNTSNLLSRDIIENSGNVPYLCASSENNAVNTYINYNTKYLNQGNCVFIGGKTFVVTYQHDDFFSNDSHNIALYLKDHIANRALLLGLVTCVYKSLSHKYSWGDSISNAKIKKDTITLPTKNGKPDFYTLELLASAFHKLMIKSVVEYTNRKIAKIKNDYK